MTSGVPSRRLWGVGRRQRPTAFSTSSILLRLAPALLAFFLGSLGLGRQSLWYDEGFSAWLAAQPPTQIISRTAADIHPPLYYLLLHVWLRFAGQSEFALRFPSLLAAVATVPLFCRLARRLLGARAAVIAATLLALSPLWLWYAREARMYTLVTAFAVAALALLAGLLRRPPQRSRLALLVVLNVAAVYTHFYAWFVVAVQALWVLLWNWRAPRRAVALLLPLAATLVAYLPWLGFVLTRLDQDRSYWDGVLDARYVLLTTLESWAAGHGLVPALAQPAGLALGALALAGLVVLIRRGRSRTALAVAALVLVPLAGVLLISFGRPKYHPRYLMLAAPGFLLALAALPGLIGGSRAAAARALARAALLVPLLIFGVADGGTLLAPPQPKDDWRGVAKLVRDENDEGEPVVLLSGHAFPVFSYYHPEGTLIPLPKQGTLDTSEVLRYSDAPALSEALAGEHGLWVVRWQDEVVDPDQVLDHLLRAAGASPDRSDGLQGIVVEHWRLPASLALPTEPEPEHELDANFAEAITLLGLDGPRSSPPVDAGLPLVLYWQARQPLESDLKMRLTVEDHNGFIWGTLDQRLGSYLHPTFRWRPADPRPAKVTVPLMVGTPPGDYFVRVAVYSEENPEGLDRLDEAGAPTGKTVRVGPFRVGRPAAPGVLGPTLAQEGARRLEGALSGPAGTDVLVEAVAARVEVPPVMQPGGRTPVKVWLRAQAPPEADVQLYLRWVQDGEPVGELVGVRPGGESWPAREWREGEVVLVQAAPHLPVTARAGPAELVAWLVGPGDVASEPIVLAATSVKPDERDYTPPALEHAQVATFGDVARLVGYDLRRADAGEAIEITIYWEALQPTDRSLTAFVHLLSREDRVLAGMDEPPARSTETWVEGEFITQQFRLPLPGTLPPAPYRLELGLYDAADPALTRLPVEGQGADTVNRRVLLHREVDLTDFD